MKWIHESGKRVQHAVRHGKHEASARDSVKNNAIKKYVILGVLVLAVAAIIFVAASIKAPDIRDDGLRIPTADGEETLYGRKKGFYTFLIFGVDKGQTNTDTIMVASYDTKNQKAALLSIPRDTLVNVRWSVKKINSVYCVLGVDGLREHVKKLLGFAPDYYVRVDLDAFVEMVDLIGGVEFDVPRNMDYDDPAQDLHIHLKKGVQTLDGENAMGLVRWRHNNNYTLGYSDIERGKTQQAFLKEAFRQCTALKNWTKISGYVEIFNKDVESDLELGEMLWLAKRAMELPDGAIESFSLPCNMDANVHGGSYVAADVKGILEMVNEHFNPYDHDLTKELLEVMCVNADGSVSLTSGTLADPKMALPPAPNEEPDEEEEPEIEEEITSDGKPVDETPDEKDDPPSNDDPDDPDNPDDTEDAPPPAAEEESEGKETEE